MSISNEFFNPYSSLVSNIFKPVDALLKETMPMSVEFVIGLQEEGKAPELLCRNIADENIDPSEELNDYRRVMNCYSNVMRDVMRFYPMAELYSLKFTLIAGDTDTQVKKFTIKILPGKITYDLEHVDTSKKKQAQGVAPWSAPIPPSQIEYMEL